jgi:hypothetical protein
MDVTKMLSELHSELEQIEREILNIEGGDTANPEGASESVTQTNWGGQSDFIS